LRKKCVWRPGFARDLLAELWRSPDPLTVIRGRGGRERKWLGISRERKEREGKNVK